MYSKDLVLFQNRSIYIVVSSQNGPWTKTASTETAPYQNGLYPKRPLTETASTQNGL